MVEAAGFCAQTHNRQAAALREAYICWGYLPLSLLVPSHTLASMTRAVPRMTSVTQPLLWPVRHYLVAAAEVNANR